MPFSSVDLKYFYVIILYFRFRYWWCLGHIIYHFRFRVMLSSFTGHLYHVSFSANQMAPTLPREGAIFDILPSKQHRLQFFSNYSTHHPSPVTTGSCNLKIMYIFLLSIPCTWVFYGHPHLTLLYYFM